MNKQQMEQALLSLNSWLAHPNALGKTPAKVECVGEFDLYELHYFIFKYKKTRLSREWLLGVSGGFIGDDLEHCGHVYSEMSSFDEKTAKQDAIQMAEMIQEYWLNEAQQNSEEEGGGSAISFVLLSTGKWKKDKFINDLKEQWNIPVLMSVEDKEANGDSLIWTVDGMLTTVSLMPAVPDGEAEQNAATNYMWPKAVEVTKTHKATLLVAVLPGDDDFIKANELLVKLCVVGLMQKGAIGVNTAGTVFEPNFYREAAHVMRKGELPYFNWIHFVLYQTEVGLSGYTFGLYAFNKLEIEILDTMANPEQLRNFLFDISAYIISEDITLFDGETIGFTKKQKFPICLSDGVALNSTTVKIGYMPYKNKSEN